MYIDPEGLTTIIEDAEFWSRGLTEGQAGPNPLCTYCDPGYDICINFVDRSLGLTSCGKCFLNPIANRVACASCGEYLAKEVRCRLNHCDRIRSNNDKTCGPECLEAPVF